MVYNGTLSLLRNYLTQFGVECTFVDGSNIASYREDVKPNTKANV